MNELFDELFEKLREVLNTNEFACHTIKNGRLYPVYKNDTNEIGLKAWKEFHAENGIYIAENGLLTEVCTSQKGVSINNLDVDKRNYACFISFNIKAIYVVPLIKENNVVAFIVMPVLGEYYDFTKDKKEKCEKIIKEYNDRIVSYKFY